VTSCFYGTFQGARTIGEGKFDARTYFVLPAYLSGNTKDEVKSDGRDLPDYMGGALMQYGATPRFDIGIQSNYYTVGFHAKWQATPSHTRYVFSPVLWLNYIIPAQTISPKLSLINGLSLSKRAELYLSIDMFRTPAIRYWDEAFEDDSLWDRMKNEWRGSLSLGAIVMLQKGTTGNSFSPFGVCVELTYPLNLGYNVILFGIGVSY
jgi:hypothetical protein